MLIFFLTISLSNKRTVVFLAKKLFFLLLLIIFVTKTLNVKTVITATIFAYFKIAE